MKRILIPMISMIALCLHSDTQEEVGQFIRETVEEAVLLNGERWKQMAPKLEAIDGDVRIPIYCEIMAEKFDDPNPKYLNHIIMRLFALDGGNLASCGNPEAIGWVRKALREKGKALERYIPRRYLILKGDERDLDIVFVYRDILATRLAGTNIVNHPYFDNRLNSGATALQSVIPSVTNTGPQALYVEAIIRQYWGRLEIEYRDGFMDSPFRDPSKIPAELLTMVVWFDEDGNPVCNVDLAKYGLTMPELDVPNKPKGKAPRPEPPTIVEVEEQPPATENEPDETPPLPTSASPCLLTVLAVTLTLSIGAVLWFARRKK